MHASAAQHSRSRSVPSASAELFVDERERDLAGVWMPRPEMHLVVRFGASSPGSLDVHAMGVRETAHRKLVRGGQRTVTARLHLGTHQAVLGVPASAIVGSIVTLEDLWGAAATRRLGDRLGDARDTVEAAAILGRAIAERRASAPALGAQAQLALAAAERLTGASVNAVALDLGVSERHLRRVFRETFGLSPKTFARLARFRRALHAAREAEHANWANIAASAGYYDQAHLIADFRAIAGATPQGLLGELRVAPWLG